MKKILSCFMLAICLIAPSIFLLSGCNGDTKDDNSKTFSKYEENDIFSYSIIENEIEITKFNAITKSCIVPQQIDGKNVVGIGKSAFAENSMLQSITLPQTLTYIGQKAFYNCTNLKAVIILNEDGVNIEEDAFDIATIESLANAVQKSKSSNVSAMNLKTENKSNCSTVMLENDTATMNKDVIFYIDDDYVVQSGSIINGKTAILTVDQKTLLQKFIDTGMLGKYQIQRTNEDGSEVSTLSVDGTYIDYKLAENSYINFKTLKNDVLTENYYLENNVKYFEKENEKLKKNNVSTRYFLDDVRIVLSEIAQSPNFQQLTINIETNSAIYQDTDQTIEFQFGDNYIVSATERYMTKSGEWKKYTYTINTNPTIVHDEIMYDEYLDCSDKKVELMIDNSLSGMHFEGQTNFLVAYGDKLYKPNLWRENYRIVGYYTDSQFTNKWDFEEDCVKNDIQLYVNFEECHQILDEYNLECWIDDCYAYIMGPNSSSNIYSSVKIPDRIKGLPIRFFDDMVLQWSNVRYLTLGNVLINDDVFFSRLLCQFIVSEDNMFYTVEDNILYNKDKTKMLNYYYEMPYFFINGNLEEINSNDMFYYLNEPISDPISLDKVFFFKQKTLSNDILTTLKNKNIDCVLNYPENKTSFCNYKYDIIDNFLYQVDTTTSTAKFYYQKRNQTQIINILPNVIIDDISYPVTDLIKDIDYNTMEIIIPNETLLNKISQINSTNIYSERISFVYRCPFARPQSYSDYSRIYIWNSNTNDICATNNSKYFLYEGKEYRLCDDKVYLSRVKCDENIVNIPETVTFENKTYDVYGIDKTSFVNSMIETINFPNTIEKVADDTFDYMEQYLITQTEVMYIGKILYYNSFLANTEHLTIKEGTTTVAKNAFNYSCIIGAEITKLKSISFPKSLITIEDYAFCEALNLDSEFLIIPKNVKYIGDYAFSGSKGIKYVNLLGDLDNLGKCAFSDSPDLVSAGIRGSISNCKKYIFANCPNFTKIEKLFSAYINGSNWNDDASVGDMFSIYIKTYPVEKMLSDTIFYDPEVPKMFEVRYKDGAWSKTFYEGDIFDITTVAFSCTLGNDVVVTDLDYLIYNQKPLIYGETQMAFRVNGVDKIKYLEIIVIKKP